ncbi:hypothetical protein ABZP36_002413 [Zizania latifolia]
MAVQITNPFAARHAVFFFAVFMLLELAVAQPATAPPPDVGCNGILLTYNLLHRDKIRPFVPVRDAQPYSFSANATVLNSGTRTLRSWKMLLTFVHGEILVNVDGAVLTSAADLPYNTTSADAGKATSFSGYPQTDLLTPIATAGDLSKIQGTVNLVGTLFAGPEPFDPLPSALSLADPSYICPPAKNVSKSLSTCCVLTPEAEANGTAGDDLLAAAGTYPQRATGDMVITYDVLQAHETTYLALVTLENDALLGRLDGWQLSWDWLHGEFISSMRGAYPREIDTSSCVYGRQGSYYKGLDFSKVLSCDRRPVVVDLPPSRYDDKEIGGINHCCRNGTILPKSIDAAQSKSAFQMEVYKMPPNLNRTKLYAPANFKVSGASPLNPEYTCEQPVRVSPTELPDPSGLASTTLATATWQVVCNMTNKKTAVPKCCVSFSAFYNESVIPCSTCACGCPASAAASCSTTAPSMLLPPYALLMPFERRPKEALRWAWEKRLGVASPMPCGDYCGVSINWHVATDYSGGWSARATVFNWEGVDMAEWFVAVVMETEAYSGFEQAYSFNATAVGNGTILMKGREGFDYLARETNMSGVDYPVPGKQQSVLSFTNRMTSHVGAFPSKLFFNGHQCAMPHTIPTAAAAGLTTPRRRLLSLFASSTLLLLLL